MSQKPQIKIKGNIQDMKKKDKNIKPKHSNFLLTINTNQQYKDDDEHLQDDIEIFDESIKTILNNIDQYINLPEAGGCLHVGHYQIIANFIYNIYNISLI